MACIERKGGHLLVVSGPSGVGKGTVCKELIGRGIDGLGLSVSATTRKPRSGEVNGINYCFKPFDEFESMVKNGELLEYANVHGNYYGTPKRFVFDEMEKLNDIILEIDIQGAAQVKKNYPDAILIFIMPPTFGDLIKRIYNRGTESEEDIKKRMINAHFEILAAEHYDYLVINENVIEATDQIVSIIIAERCRRDRFILDYDCFVYKEEKNDISNTI